MKKIPDLSFWKLWNISFGFFGVQIAYALQSANISRIFSTLGADPHSLSYFWILPPLAGIIVQPIIGALSDKTWCRFGRRIPYLFVGALIAVLVMCLLPNAGSFGMSVSAAMIFGLFSLMFLDTSINIAMQPFKMMVGDMVNEKQKGLAYSIQSFLCNAGSLAGYLFPFIFAAVGISNIAPKGVIPDSVIYSFYIGAAILIICVIYTTVKVKEYPPELYAEYHGITKEIKEEKSNIFSLLVKAPKAFWTVGLVQFFCWAAFMFMWTYTNGTVAAGVFDTPSVEVIKDGISHMVLDTQSVQYQNAGDWVGILFAVQAVGSVLWAMALPLFKSRKFAYSLSLILGGIGFISTMFIHDQYALFVSFLLIGCAWAAMLALPFTILTNALTGGHMGTYLGLFNCTICVPQIVAAVAGGWILRMFTTPGKKKVGVIGAGHTKGILSALEKLDRGETLKSLDELNHIPESGNWGKILGFLIPALIIGLVIYGIAANGWTQGLTTFLYWIAVNAGCTLIATTISLAHPLNILACSVTAPFFALNPVLGVGMLGGILEATFRKPKVKDFQDLNDDAVTFKGWYRNRILHCLLVFFFSSIGSVIGTFIAFPMLIARI